MNDSESNLRHHSFSTTFPFMTYSLVSVVCLLVILGTLVLETYTTSRSEIFFKNKSISLKHWLHQIFFRSWEKINGMKGKVRAILTSETKKSKMITESRLTSIFLYIQRWCLHISWFFLCHESRRWHRSLNTNAGTQTMKREVTVNDDDASHS